MTDRNVILNRLRTVPWWVLTCWIAVSGCGNAILPSNELAIMNARIVRLLGNEPSELVSIVTRGDSIVSIEPSGGRTFAPAPNVIDAQGGFVTPGLVDMHVHVRHARELELYLGSGITTLRNMNGRFGTPIAWRDSLSRGLLRGPRFITASPVLTDEFDGYQYDVDGPDTARALVRRFHDEGFDLIKIYHLADASVRAIVDEAARVGIPVAGHIPLPNADLATTLALGMVSLEHLDEFVGPGFSGVSDYARIPDVARQLADAHVTVGTILAQWRAVNRGLDDPDWFVSDSLVRTATRYYGEEGRTQLERLAADMRSRDDESRAGDRSDFDFLFALVRGLDVAGVNIVASTDSHQPLAPAGEALFNELELLVEAGLTPVAALRAATYNAARALGTTSRSGSVAVSNQADLLLLDDDPTADISALRRPRGLVARGVWYDATQLERLRTPRPDARPDS